METSLISLSDDLARIVQASSPRVVSVRARRHYPSSGFRWTPEIVVTAAHTIERDEDISVILGGGETVEATLVGRDAATDLAALKMNPSGSFGAELNQTDCVKAGELALVLARSPDSGVNASLGIISAMYGPWKTWRGGNLDAYIRLDARLFPNSSGGAVVNARGELIGIATSALSRIAGLAIPVSTVKVVTQKLLERGFVPRGYLGLGLQPIVIPQSLREKLNLPNEGGLIVLTAESGSPADKAGVVIGDILVGLGDARIEQVEDVQAYSDSGVIGKPVQIKFIRGGALKVSTVTIGERPSRRS